MRVIKFILSCVTCSFSTLLLHAKENKETKHRTGSIYFSWGYNQEWYTKSTLHVKQSGLGNEYDMIQVQAHDHLGWNNGIFNKALTIPQYNYRLGYYFNSKQDLGVELNFDHTKYLIVDPQNIHVKGTIAGNSVDESILFTQSQGFYYYLNNGANFFLFNIVKRYNLYHRKDNKFALDAIGKAGIGPVIPHTQNMLFGQANNQGFQLGGWNTGIETVIRATIEKYAYIEFSQKGDYARYSGLNVYQGKAHQAFGTYELILSVGVFLPTTKNHPMFLKAPEKNNGTSENVPLK